jgi:transcriptional regulator with XRE-family HTH domain
MASRTRRTRSEIEGRREARAIAATLGGAVRRARRERRWDLETLGAKVGLGRTRVAEIERGDGTGAGLETWVALGIALGRPLAVTFTRPPGAGRDEPADAGHLAIQEHLLALARATGQSGTFEVPTKPTDPRHSTDVGIRDPIRRVRTLAECWNTFGDLGAAVRATTRKAAEAAATWPDDRIATVWVVRATATNRALLARYPHILDAAFPGSSRRWVAALTDGAEPPVQPGLVWFEPETGRLIDRRRRP